MTTASRVTRHSQYNPSKVLSDGKSREEYDYLFSKKDAEAEVTCMESLATSFKNIGLGFVDLISSSASNSDPSAAGEIQRKAAMGAAGFQSSLGLAKALTGDVYSGVYNMLLGILGVSCSREGKSKDMLKTYVVITFINGCVQAMEVVQVSLAGMSLLGKGLPFMMAVGHVVTLLNPISSFLGAYLGWQFVKTAKHQYLIALAHYQLQMLMMHQQQQHQQQQQQSKRLPTITEEFDESKPDIMECTGGSNSALTN